MRGKVGWEGAAGYGDFEPIVACEGVGLSLEHIGVEVGLEGGSGGKDVEFGVPGAHCGCEGGDCGFWRGLCGGAN